MATDLSAALDAAYACARGFHDARAQRRPNAAATVEWLLDAFGGPTPEAGSDSHTVIERLARAADPGLTGSAGARFFGWVIGASHPVGIAADWLTSVWGQNGASYHSSPANAVAEHVAARWLVDILRLPPTCAVGFTTGATMAQVVCIAAARNELLRRVGWDVEADGMFGAPPISVCVGEEAHASVFLALRYLGFGERRVIRIAADGSGRMLARALRAAIAQVSGPLLVIAQAGHINTGAFDPFDAIAEATHARGGWLHVDGAFGLWARACPATAHLAAGAERADSWGADGHKWLQVPYDAGYAFVRDAAAHRRAMSTAAGYLPPPVNGVTDPSDTVPELSRRARGFATWALIAALGRRGIADMVGRHCDLARRMAQRLARHDGVHVLNDVELNQFVVRFGSEGPSAASDEATRRTIGRVQADGVCFVAGATWRGVVVMRVSVISWPTTDADVDRSADAIIDAWHCFQRER
jgi:glutamate/tyrosine decarboxylase-like PLP-dependent enzyme